MRCSLCHCSTNTTQAKHSASVQFATHTNGWHRHHSIRNPEPTKHSAHASEEPAHSVLPHMHAGARDPNAAACPRMTTLGMHAVPRQKQARTHTDAVAWAYARHSMLTRLLHSEALDHICMCTHTPVHTKTHSARPRPPARPALLHLIKSRARAPSTHLQRAAGAHSSCCRHSCLRAACEGP